MVRRHRGWVAAALVVVAGAAFGQQASAQARTQAGEPPQDPRIGVWRNAANPGNVMNYEAIAGGGTRLKVDAVNAEGQVTSYWGYDAFFDGSWHPVTGSNRDGTQEDATVILKDARTTEIRYRRPAGGQLDRILENVVAPNGNTLWVIFRDAEGIVTNIVTYERVR